MKLAPADKLIDAAWDREVPWLWQAVSVLLPIAVLTGLALRMYAVQPPGQLDAHTDATDVRFALPLVDRQKIYAEIADHHTEWQNYGSRFEDPWSQHDDYHNHLSRHVHYLAGVHSVPKEVVFLIYDEGLHRHWTNAKGETLPPNWVPLKPRTKAE